MQHDRFFFENVINSLRLGIVPVRYVEHLTVGRKEAIKNINSCIEDTSCGLGKCIIFEGDYGAGKSHIINYARFVAQEHNFVISSISADQTLLFNKMERVMNAIIEAMEFPDIGIFNSFEKMLNKLLFSWHRSKILDWCENNIWATDAEIKFKMGIRTYDILLRTMNYNAAEEIMRWLQGEKVDNKRIKTLIETFLNENKKMGSFKIVQTDIIYLIQSIGQMLKAIGYSGWMIIVDECENFFELSPNNSKTKLKIFTNLDSMTKGLRNIFSAFTFTPRQLDKIYEYFLYQNKYDKEYYIPNFLLPSERKKKIFRLHKLNDEKLINLFRLICETYENAFPEKKIGITYKKYIEKKIISLAPSEKECPRKTIRMIIEMLDYFSTNDINLDNISSNNFILQPDNYSEVNNEHLFVNEEHPKHEEFVIIN